MFQKINKFLTYIPVFLIWEYLFLFLIRNSNWYEKNRQFIDDIDNCIVFISMFHFLVYVENYSKTQLFYCFSVFCIIMLQFLYFHIPENIYFLIYLLLISLPIITNFI